MLIACEATEEDGDVPGVVLQLDVKDMVPASIVRRRYGHSVVDLIGESSAVIK